MRASSGSPTTWALPCRGAQCFLRIKRTNVKPLGRRLKKARFDMLIWPANEIAVRSWLDMRQGIPWVGDWELVALIEARDLSLMRAIRAITYILLRPV